MFSVNLETMEIKMHAGDTGSFMLIFINLRFVHVRSDNGCNLLHK